MNHGVQNGGDCKGNGTQKISGKSMLVKYYFIWLDVWPLFTYKTVGSFGGKIVGKYTSPIEHLGFSSAFPTRIMSKLAPPRQSAALYLQFSWIFH